MKVHTKSSPDLSRPGEFSEPEGRNWLVAIASALALWVLLLCAEILWQGQWQKALLVAGWAASFLLFWWLANRARQI